MEAVIGLYADHNPYANLTLRPNKRLTNFVDGWSVTKAETYGNFVLLSNATVIIEVGVWRGLSTSYLAASLKARRSGVLVRSQHSAILHVHVACACVLVHDCHCTSDACYRMAQFAVDTWLGAIEFWNRRISRGKHDQSRDLELVNGYPTTFHTFLSNMVLSLIHI